MWVSWRTILFWCFAGIHRRKFSSNWPKLQYPYRERSSTRRADAPVRSISNRKADFGTRRSYNSRSRAVRRKPLNATLQPPAAEEGLRAPNPRRADAPVRSISSWKADFGTRRSYNSGSRAVRRKPLNATLQPPAAEEGLRAPNLRRAGRPRPQHPNRKADFGTRRSYNSGSRAVRRKPPNATLQPPAGEEGLRAPNPRRADATVRSTRDPFEIRPFIYEN